MTVTPLPERPRVDVGELGGSLYNDAVRAVAQTVVLTMDWLEENDRGLNQLQKLELVNGALLSTAGLEQGSFAESKGKLGEAGIETWNA